ncbi:MAG: hypothetical protein BV456_01770 [Thermoplasmata archaeon M8B2D]|nr:MAG: hypothetical protein BV456_01770 [Thermoplasmata archaeon M8B2D]
MDEDMVVLLSWIIGDIELSVKNVKELSRNLEENFFADEKIPSFLQIVFNGNLDENMQAVREVAYDDLMYETQKRIEELEK